MALYSRDLEEVEATVAFIRERVIIASLLALAIALAGGYLIARRLARRVRRLEVAASEVARGHFQDPLPVDSTDELGQLTHTFNEMQDQLRRLDDVRKDFIATASHELRTPIFSLGGFVELLQDEDLDEEHPARVPGGDERAGGAAAEAVGRSPRPVTAGRGSLELEREPVDLAELARSVVGEFRPALAEHRTDLTIELPGDGSGGQLRP